MGFLAGRHCGAGRRGNARHGWPEELQGLRADATAHYRTSPCRLFRCEGSSVMTMDNTRSSKDYELEAEASRQRLAESLDELVDRLTPGQVVDEILTYAKAGNGTFFRALSNGARENPIPALLIGAGSMMFLSEKSGVSRYVARRISEDGSVTTGSPTHAALRQGSYAATRKTGSMARSIGSR